jgi:hypothetical protein
MQVFFFSSRSSRCLWNNAVLFTQCIVKAIRFTYKWTISRWRQKTPLHCDVIASYNIRYRRPRLSQVNQYNYMLQAKLNHIYICFSYLVRYRLVQFYQLYLSFIDLDLLSVTRRMFDRVYHTGSRGLNKSATFLLVILFAEKFHVST